MDKGLLWNQMWKGTASSVAPGGKDSRPAWSSSREGRRPACARKWARRARQARPAMPGPHPSHHLEASPVPAVGLFARSAPPTAARHAGPASQRRASGDVTAAPASRVSRCTSHFPVSSHDFELSIGAGAGHVDHGHETNKAISKSNSTMASHPIPRAAPAGRRASVRVGGGDPVAVAAPLVRAGRSFVSFLGACLPGWSFHPAARSAHSEQPAWSWSHPRPRPRCSLGWGIRPLTRSDVTACLHEVVHWCV